MPTPPYTYDDPRFIYDEEGLFYDGNFDCVSEPAGTNPPFIYDDSRFVYDEEGMFYDGGFGRIDGFSSIDPLSVATHGFIINDNEKIIFPLTVSTLGWLKPEQEIIEINPIKKFGGNVSGKKHLTTNLDFRIRDKKEPEFELNLQICIDLVKVNKIEVDFRQINKKYFIKHGRVDVKTNKIKHRQNKTNIDVINVHATHESRVEMVVSEMRTKISTTKILGTNAKIKTSKQLFNIKVKKK